MTCDFMSFSAVFQSYQDDGRKILKGCVIPSLKFKVFNVRSVARTCSTVQHQAVCNGTPFTIEILPRAGIELGPLDQ